MAKTDLTKEIEKCLRLYDPAEMSGIKINKLRGRSTAFEVPVENGTTACGIIDCVKVSEYFGDVEIRKVCIAHTYHTNFQLNCPKGYEKEQTPKYCDEPSCRWSAPRCIGVAKILLTCFEIKVSVADFNSKNGHNFVGNLNYYVMPKDLYEKVKEKIPEDIGVILYIDTDKVRCIRKKKNSEFKHMTDDAQKWLVLSVLKRIRRTAPSRMLRLKGRRRQAN